MGFLLSKPKTDKVSQDGGSYFSRYGVTAMQGWRRRMEDAHLALPSFDTMMSLYGVFDGHGGPAVSRWASDHLADTLKKNMECVRGHVATQLLNKLSVSDGDTTGNAEEQYDVGCWSSCLETVSEWRLITLESEHSTPPSGLPTEVIVICEALQQTFLDLDILMSFPNGREELELIHLKIEEEEEREERERMRARGNELDVTSTGSTEGSRPPNVLEECLLRIRNEREGPVIRVIPLGSNNEANDKRITSADVHNGTGDPEGTGGSCTGGSCTDGEDTGGMSAKCQCREGNEVARSTMMSAGGIAGAADRRDTESIGGRRRRPLDKEELEALSQRRGVRFLMNVNNISLKNVNNENDGRSSNNEDQVIIDDDKVEGLRGSCCEGNGVEEFSAGIECNSVDGNSGMNDGTPEQYYSSADAAAARVTTGSLTRPRQPARTAAAAIRQELGSAANCGSTAVVSVILVCEGGVAYLITANAGDSRAVLCRGGEAVALSKDHKPLLVEEKLRITTAGGIIIGGRVDGNLNLSRTLGDLNYKCNRSMAAEDQKISAFPDVRVMEITARDEFVVLACDGIWDCMSSQVLVDLVRQRLLGMDTDDKEDYDDEKYFLQISDAEDDDGASAFTGTCATPPQQRGSGHVSSTADTSLQTSEELKMQATPLQATANGQSNFRAKVERISGICEELCDTCLAKRPSERAGIGCDNMTLLVVELGRSLARRDGSSKQSSGITVPSLYAGNLYKDAAASMCCKRELPNENRISQRLKSSATQCAL